MWFQESDKKKKGWRQKLFEEALKELDVDDLVSSLVGILKEKTEKKIKKELKGEFDDTLGKLLRFVHLSHGKKEEEEEKKKKEEKEEEEKEERRGVKAHVKGGIGKLAKKVLHKVEDGKENIAEKNELKEIVRSILKEELKEAGLHAKEEKKHKHKKKKSDWVEKLDDEKAEEAKEEIDELRRKISKWSSRPRRYSYPYPYPYYGPYRLPYGDVYYGPYSRNYRRIYGRPDFSAYLKVGKPKKPDSDKKKDVYTVENLHLHVDR